MRKKRARELLVGLACALAAAGCGGDGGGNNKNNAATNAHTNTQTGTNANTPATTTADAAQTPAPPPVLVSTPDSSGDEGESVERVVAEVASFTDELLKKIEDAQDPAAGLAEAQKFFDARAGQMRARVGAAQARARASAEARRSLLESEVDNSARVSNLQTKYLDRAMSDSAFKTRLDKLVSDYRKLFED